MDIRVFQGNNVFHGYVQDISENIIENRKAINIVAMDYTGKAKKIVVSEKYVNQDLGDILSDFRKIYA